MYDEILNISIFSHWTILFRILCTMVAAFIIGFERSQDNQPAGMRTHMAISLGACGIMILSTLLPLRYIKLIPGGDPGRMAAQVISGIGFLGAGAILRFGVNIKGLTTAASIWTTSGIGLMFGAGLYKLGFSVTASLFLILNFFSKIEKWLITKQNLRVLTVVFSSADMPVKSVMQSIQDYVNVQTIDMTEYIEKKEIVIEAHCRIPRSQNIREVFEHIKSMGNVKTIKIE